MAASLRVAVADDDYRMRELVQQMLHNLGHEVVAVAETGESLVKQCEIAQPDVVITGTLTPEMRGAAAAAVIYKRRPMPIILYSGHCDPDLVLNAEHKHVFMYLAKPISQECLETALKDCRRQELYAPSGDIEGDTEVFVGPSAEASGGAPCREPSRPPYRQLPR